MYFNTSQEARYVDQLVGDVANESKVGYQSLTPNIQLQISKDAELLNGGTFQEVNWHFFQSPVTGLGRAIATVVQRAATERNQCYNSLIMSYTIIHPPFTLKLREMPKKELHRYYQWFMDVLPQRVNELANAVKETPGFETWEPDNTPASLDTLGNWFAGQVETRNRTQEELQAIKDRLVFPMDIPSEELTNRTFSWRWILACISVKC